MLPHPYLSEKILLVHLFAMGSISLFRIRVANEWLVGVLRVVSVSFTCAMVYEAYWLEGYLIYGFL